MIKTTIFFYIAIASFWIINVSAQPFPAKNIQTLATDTKHCLATQLRFKSTAQTGEPVVMTFTIKNKCDFPLRITIPVHSSHAFTVTSDDNTKVWRRWLPKDASPKNAKVAPPSGVLVMNTLILKIKFEDLSPHQELSYTAKWDQRNSANKTVPLGRYWVTGILRLESGPSRNLKTKPQPLVILP